MDARVLARAIASVPKILCIDDHYPTANEVRNKLRQIPGYEVLVADNNDDALRLLGDLGEQIRLVVQDITRPPGRIPTGGLAFVPGTTHRLAADAGLVFFRRYLQADSE